MSKDFDESQQLQDKDGTLAERGYTWTDRVLQDDGERDDPSIPYARGNRCQRCGVPLVGRDMNRTQHKTWEKCVDAVKAASLRAVVNLENEIENNRATVEAANAQRSAAERMERAATDERNRARAENERLRIALGVALPYCIRFSKEIDADDQRCIWHGATEPLGTPIYSMVEIPYAEYQALNRIVLCAREALKDVLEGSGWEILRDDISRELALLDKFARSSGNARETEV